MNNANTTSQGASPIGGPLTPPKKWDEQTDTEKLETLRNQVRMMQYLNRSIADLQAEVFRLKTHEHGGDGKPVIPLHSANANGLGALAGVSYDPLA